jgi:glutamate--cysteine ligase
MFLFVRDGQIFENTGQTFRDFMTHGFAGQTATEADWRLHLGTLFPEVRLKNTLEVRCCDSVPPPLTYAIPALLTGLGYDAGVLEQARALVDRLSLEGALALQREVAVAGLQARFEGRPLAVWCEQLLDLSAAGLVSRARKDTAGRDESVYLEPLRALVASGQTPADAMLNALGSSGGSPVELLRQQWQALLQQLG